MLFRYFIRDELNINVRVKSLRQVLSDGVQTRSLDWLVILLADVLVYDQELIFSDLFLVHLKHGSFSILWILKADISVIFKVVLLIALYLSGFNLTVLNEKFLKLIIIGALW